MTEKEFRERVNLLASSYGISSSDEYGRCVQSLLEDCLTIIIIDENGDHRLPWMRHYYNRYFTVEYTIESYIHAYVRNIIDRIHAL